MALHRRLEPDVLRPPGGRQLTVDVFFWESLQAATVLVAVPIAFAFNLLAERFVTGFTTGP